MNNSNTIKLGRTRNNFRTPQLQKITKSIQYNLELILHVRGEGKWNALPSSSLDPGDLVRIRLGEIVPADLRLIEGDFLQVDESALTGESLLVEKRGSKVAFSGSIVRQGEMTALVFATRMSTWA
jgi:H+-transporting ATPase